MRSGDILHVVWRTPSLVVSSGSSSSVEAFLLRTDTLEVSGVATPTVTLNINSQMTFPLLHTNRAQICRFVTSGSLAFAAPTPMGTISERANAAAPTSSLVRHPSPVASIPKAAAIEKIELAIDSLQDYDLIKPIPVLIESLGDKVFVAEAPDLNLSTSGNSVGAAFLLLKEQIITTYEGHRSKKGPDPQRGQQLAALEAYIGKPRRHWF